MCENNVGDQGLTVGSAGCLVVVRVAGVCGCGEGRHSPQEASMSGEAVSRGLVGGVSLRY